MSKRDPVEIYSPAWRRDPSFTPWESNRVPWEQCDEKRRAALRKAWTVGDLSYVLDPVQRGVYRKIRAWMERPLRDRGRRYVLDVSRRWGKSSVMLTIAFEERIRHKRSRKRMAYWTDTGRMAEEIIILEVFPWLTMDCPPELIPGWYPSRHRIIWDHEHKDLDLCPALELAGLDNPDRARGRALYRGFLDEGGFIPDLEYIDKSVISKMMLTEKESTLICGSTPPLTPVHYWTTEVCPKARAHDAYHHGTIYDNCRLSDEEIMLEINDSGGPHSTSVRRELYAEHIVDETMAILPEADEAIKQGTLVVENEPPDWRNCYVTMDPGWSDATGTLFGYVDFQRQKVVVEDEWLRIQATSAEIAAGIQERERELWRRVPRWSRRNGGEQSTNPHRRWTDIDHRLIADLSHDHGIRFSPTDKADLDQQIVRVRNWILDRKLEVHPRCKKLIEQMQHGVYANSLRRKFARQGNFGHFDLLAALVYLCRNTEPLLRLNPRPPWSYGVDFSQMHRGDHESNRGQSKRRIAQSRRQSARINRIRGRKGARGPVGR